MLEGFAYTWILLSLVAGGLGVVSLFVGNKSDVAIGFMVIAAAFPSLGLACITLVLIDIARTLRSMRNDNKLKQ
jgi:hypothetical protein